MKQFELYKWKDNYIIIDDRSNYIRMPEAMAKELGAEKINLWKSDNEPDPNQLEIDLEEEPNLQKLINGKFGIDSKATGKPVGNLVGQAHIKKENE